MPARDCVLEVVADVRDAVRPRDDLALGRRRRRSPPRMVAHTVERLDAQVQRFERDVGAVDRVVVATLDVRRQRFLRRVAGRPVTAVVRERDRLGERHAEVRTTRDARRDLRDLDCVREAGAEMVVFRRDEHLALAGEATPRLRVLHPVEVALEAEPVRVGLLGAGALARTDRAGRARREQRVERRLPLLAGTQRAADERIGIGMRSSDRS